MKKTLLTLLYLIPVAALAQADFITTSATSYTPEEMIINMLSDNDNIFLSESSITYSSGSEYDINSIGYFEQNNSSFPFENGIVLSTGSIENVPGPKLGTSQSSGTQNWGGDDDLFTIVNSQGFTGGLYNATSVEFDFLAIESEITIDFLFASEEYGLNQCSLSDHFAIFLTELTEPTEYANLAVIPGTTLPVNVINIRNNQYNNYCESANAAYFDSFNEPGDLSPINFNGSTIPMQAIGTVIPGSTYRLKIVIADGADTSYDSAIFIDSENFMGNNAPLTVQAPTGEINQDFTEGETLADLEVEGENILWYETETSNTPLSIDTPLSDGVTYYATQSINETESSERLAVTVHEVLGITEGVFKTFTYYPNPVTNILTLNNANIINRVEVYNMVGQKILTDDFSTAEVQLDISSLEIGIYIIRLKSQEQQKTIRIRKN